MVTNYAKSIGSDRTVRTHCFDDRSRAECQKALDWLAAEGAEGRQTAVFHRPKNKVFDGYARVGEFKDAPS